MSFDSLQNVTYLNIGSETIQIIGQKSFSDDLYFM